MDRPPRRNARVHRELEGVRDDHGVRCGEGETHHWGDPQAVHEDDCLGLGG